MSLAGFLTPLLLAVQGRMIGKKRQARESKMSLEVLD